MRTTLESAADKTMPAKTVPAVGVPSAPALPADLEALLAQAVACAGCSPLSGCPGSARSRRSALDASARHVSMVDRNHSGTPASSASAKGSPPRSGIRQRRRRAVPGAQPIASSMSSTVMHSASARRISATLGRGASGTTPVSVAPARPAARPTPEPITPTSHCRISRCRTPRRGSLPQGRKSRAGPIT
jgi:hypothetical protein